MKRILRFTLVAAYGLLLCFLGCERQRVTRPDKLLPPTQETHTELKPSSAQKQAVK